jgi:DNA-binding IclR family transcriptional regulator
MLAFQPENREIGVVELSRMVDLHKSTVSRLLKVLMTYDFIQQNPLTKKFSLGPSTLQLGQSLQRSLELNIAQIAKPHVDDLRDSLNETVVFEVMGRDGVVIAYVADGSMKLRLIGNIGDRVPFHVSAGAKACLSYLEMPDRRRLLSDDLEQLTENTITDIDELEQQFKEARKNGIAFDREEGDDGTSAVGAPIFNSQGNPVAAIVVAGPSARMDLDNGSRVIEELKGAVKKVSEKLLFKGQH